MIKKPTIAITSSLCLNVSSSFVNKMAVVKAPLSQSTYKRNEQISEAVSKVLEGYDWTTVQQTSK